MHRSICTLALLSSSLLAPPSSAQTSTLWGHAGEEWDPAGRLPDFSHAGYRGGEAPLPVLPVVADVTDFGALGDGVTDDVQAFRAAIASAASQGGGAVSIPPGTFVIGDVLEIAVDGVVLRGAGSGSGGTTLHFPNHLRGLTGTPSPWFDGEGGLVWIGDRGPLDPGLGPQITTVVGAQLRGDDELLVANAGAIAPGDWVVLRQTDPGDDSLGLHVHNGQASPGTCSWQPRPVDWPVRVESKSGNLLELAQPLRLDVRTAWSPRLFRYQPVRGSGVEHLNLESAPHSYPGHRQEAGYNPITLEGALDCWIKDVEIAYADNGPSFTGLTKHCTMQDVVFRQGYAGHHGLSIRSRASDNLLDGFSLPVVYQHGISVDHGPSGNVVRRGTGKDLSLDHHRDGPYENLFTDLDVGFGSQVWASGGASCAGPHGGARNTYWNLRSSGWSAPPSPAWVQIQQNLVPAQTSTKSANNAWLEEIAAVEPQDLYASQLERRLEDQVLRKSDHTVVTFEDGTDGALGRMQGTAPVLSGGALRITDGALARFVDPTTTFDDQEVLFQVLSGLPRGATIGVQFRAADTAVAPAQATRVFLEGRGGTGAEAEQVVAHLQAPSGLALESVPLSVDPRSVQPTVRVLVTADRVRAWVDDELALDHTGIARPAGGGFTSLFALRGGGSGGTLGFEQAAIRVPGGPAGELHLDRRGVLWVTVQQQGLFAGAFHEPSFTFSLGGTLELSLQELFAVVAPIYFVGLESVSSSHATFGLDPPLPAGTRLGIRYGDEDETVVPWW